MGGAVGWFNGLKSAVFMSYRVKKSDHDKAYKALGKK